jgi:hypothetical protein
LLLYATWYVVLLEAGWTLCFLKLAGLMGVRAVMFFSGSFLLLVLLLALVGGGLVLLDAVLYGRYNDSVACSCECLLLPWLQVLLLLGFGLLQRLKLFICQWGTVRVRLSPQLLDLI